MLTDAVPPKNRSGFLEVTGSRRLFCPRTAICRTLPRAPCAMKKSTKTRCPQERSADNWTMD
jgi:hypothetical protein